LIHITRGLQRKNSRKIRRSTQQITGIRSSNPPNRRKRDLSVDMLTHRSGARSVAQRGMI
jgi:hypothetical protein